MDQIEERLERIPFRPNVGASIDVSMFYHPKTRGELAALQRYLRRRSSSRQEDDVDRWIRMVATNRLSGHSSGFFSVYTLPPNQATSPANQRKINRRRRQSPEYRNVRELILKKSRALVRSLTDQQHLNLSRASREARFMQTDARHTQRIPDGSVQLTVTSPPFLDTVNYAQDNWLRCWFNDIDQHTITRRVTVLRSLEAWCSVMEEVFSELFRITRPNGVVAFEVGEIRKRNLKLDEIVVPLGLKAGFRCEAILINRQRFTKTSNIWGVHNNRKGTNTNRIVLFRKS
jgi:hypothetical protein